METVETPLDAPLARSFVWWPNMDKQLEEKVKKCGTCTSMGMAQKAMIPDPC